MMRLRLGDLVTPDAPPPVFVTGGPAREPFAGEGPAGFANHEFAVHHAMSWGSPFALAMMPSMRASARAREEGAHGAIARWLSEVRLLAQASPLPLAVQVWGALTLAAESAGPPELMRLLLDGGSGAAALVQASEATAEELAARVLEAAAPAPAPSLFWIAEPIAALLDPARLAQWGLSGLRRMCAAAGAAGVTPVVHVSGGALHAVPAVKAAGAAGVSITAGTPLAAAADALGEGGVVFGNLDSMRLLDRDERWLREAGRSMAEEMAGRRFVATPGSALRPETPVEAVAAFVDGIRGV